MKLVGFFLFIVTLFSPQSGRALIGGQSIEGANYPYVVMLSYDGYDFKECSGVVLAPRRVLTSVKCLFHLSQQIPASFIYVHSSTNGKIGPFWISLEPNTTPSVQVSSYVIHPQNPYSSGPYNLAILKLSTNIDATPGYIYNGSQQFVGQNGTALGWEKMDLPPNPITYHEYVLKRLVFPLIQSNTGIGSLCYDNISPTGTVYCGGFRNATRYLEFSQDEGGPMIKDINSKNVVIGILSDASNGQQFEGVFQYEKYARVSAMINFIKQHAPNTQFWNENSGVNKTNIIPVLHLLLLGD